jgi:hypothetical protein
VELTDLVRAVLAHDALAARQWVADAARVGLHWPEVAMPQGLDATELALAAGLAEMMAERAGKSPPGWAAGVDRAPEVIFLVQAAESMPRLRLLCQEEGPLPLRRRGLLAPPEFLTVA